ncbi:LysR family transcriptional regulator [Amycolatopsis suaedae]|uniref:LysR family transcriptional regulator n=1 Tax=Amycolatopsis suaedae TaxID=2510978 RepID=A0A4Q7J4H6_9PSEU|nr:LysR family transcriptional regulator [Amycolatopsis suaedae]RZQ61907.1 LysR family transcriptional regulator [Amycolatopsis suaedae]
MDTQLLRTFLTLARTGSFTAAAADLHVVQSTVTSHIKSLEGQLGLPLVDRLPGGSRLTPAGTRVAQHAREVLDAQDRLFAAARADEVVAGEVTVGAPESMCAYRLPVVIAELATRHPELRVHLAPAGTSAALAGLRAVDGRFDVALVLDDQVPADGQVVGAEPVTLVAAPAHPAAHGTVTWRELAGFAHFLLEEGCSYSDRFAAKLAGPARITRFGSIEAARSCVLAGLGLSVLPRIAVAAQLADGSLREVAVDLPDVPLAVVTDPRRWVSPAVATVTEAIGAAWR